MANFYGSDIDDTTFGGLYDNLYGGDGRDFIGGNAAANEIYGGQGNDVVLGTQHLTFSGEGTPADPFANPTFGPSGNDYLEGGAGSDIAYGADGRDEIYGGGGDDSGTITSVVGLIFAGGGLFGGGGNDLIDGGAGADLLDGGNDNDALFGGGGQDTCVGGLGRDVQSGGSGADFFDFNAMNETGVSGGSRDQILDFERGQDHIDLRTIDASTARGGNNAFKFIGSNAFSDKAGELRIRDAGSNLLVQGDVNGDGKADFEIHVRNVATLTKFDLIL